jgi:prepilin-type N-terminal cleavage/methylation domain-containing protein
MNPPQRPLATRRNRSVRANRATSRAGFTLLEVMVALALSALLLLGARALLEQVGDAAAHIAGSAAAVDHDANAERLLRALAGRAEPPRAGEEVVGTPQGVRFATWCETPAGWLERCSATLAVLRVDGAPALAVQAGTGDPVMVRRGLRSGHLLYLRDPAEGGVWAPTWRSGVSVPVAFGVVLDGDTLIVRVGERG